MKFNFKKTMPRVLCVAGGALASNAIGSKVGAKVNPYLVMVGKMALGAMVIPSFVKGATGEQIGDGFIADAALQGGRKVLPDVITGYNDAAVGAPFSIDEDYSNVNGYNDAAVGGNDDADGLSGTI